MFSGGWGLCHELLSAFSVPVFGRSILGGIFCVRPGEGGGGGIYGFARFFFTYGA